ncbi:MAG: hypothetical protein EXS35_08385 [Pedosphaera sp.]|nr:hypothetical protein [Pedosphaera sp.]
MNSPTDFDSSAGATPNRGPDAFALSGPILANFFRRFLSCNPLYLASAGLLLYGINQLSSDPSVAGAEPAQITFNFAALFLYEILLVWTAIVLARRTIWYDALLLVGLENLFVLIPFSLVSRAVQLDEPLGRKLCAAAVLLAVLKFWALRRYIPRLNLPPRLLALGAVIMAANVALALGLRRIYDEPHAVNSWLTSGWLFGLPLLIALGNFLPKPTRVTASPEQKAWLPHAALGIWIAVTGCHLGGMGFVYSFKWTAVLLAPSLWVLAWTVVRQSGALVSAGARRQLIIAPLLVTALAMDDLKLCFTLNLLNAAGFAWVWWRHRTRTLFWLGAVSLIASLALLPIEWAAQVMPRFDRIEWAFASLTAAALGAIVASRNPKWTLAGGGVCFVATAVLMKNNETSWHWAAQVGLFFCVAHSLRWRDGEIAGARTARLFLCAVWVAQSFLWSFTDASEALRGGCLSGVVVLACYALHRWLTGGWLTRLVPISACVVLLSSPGASFAERIKSAPPGYLAVAGSFLLFGLGTIAALTKHRWHKSQTN